MTYSDDGGSAFPITRESSPKNYQGMSLRDWFAGQALAGMLAQHGSYGITNGPESSAVRAYEHADAMLAAREPRP